MGERRGVRLGRSAWKSEGWVEGRVVVGLMVSEEMVAMRARAAELEVKEAKAVVREGETAIPDCIFATSLLLRGRV